MERVNLRYLRALVKEGKVKDITTGVCPGGLEKIAYSTGVYGINGGLLMGKDGAMYAVIGRTANLFRLF